MKFKYFFKFTKPFVYKYTSYCGRYIVTQKFNCLDCGCDKVFRNKRQYHLSFFEGNYNCLNCKKNVNYYSDDFINSKNPLAYLEEKFSKTEQAKLNIRKLTPLEALKLQGFNKSFLINAQKEGVSNHQLYKQAGNAVSVNTVYSILHYLFEKNIIAL
jgi:site-specific DNA-cytosine methylase